ncbi:hypothetical protein JTB14_010561 [Gonioctena quinquepunctata]|nr:hypothetical protein JTB14_010561 [Gonioctena quinquepunctata]
MTSTTSKDNFLGNPKNKGRLISMLSIQFLIAGLEHKQAEEHADTLIVATELSMAPSNDIVGEDVDLLAISIGLCQVDNVFFLKHGKEHGSCNFTS